MQKYKRPLQTPSLSSHHVPGGRGKSTKLPSTAQLPMSMASTMRLQLSQRRWKFVGLSVRCSES